MTEADESPRVAVRVERTGPGRYSAVNARGGRIEFGTGTADDFAPVELLLAAIGGCTSIDVDVVTARRAEPEEFAVTVSAESVRDESGHHLTGIEVTYRIVFPAGPDGDQARALLPDQVRRSHDRLCTVGRTVELGTPIGTRIDPA